MGFTQLFALQPGCIGPRRSVTSHAAPAPVAPSPGDTPHYQQVLQEIAEGNKVMVAQTAPAVRVALGEMQDLGFGVNVQEKLITALRTLGFDYVFDVDTGADLTILEEGTELLQRLRHHLLKTQPGYQAPEGASTGPLPMFSSCCPGWINMVEVRTDDVIPYVSSCKSPHLMQGAVLKSHFAPDVGVSPADMSVVSIMPCVRKQGEADRNLAQFCSTGIARDVDHVITTRELGELLNERGIVLDYLEDGTPDQPMGQFSGGGALFGTTGGVLEAAVRTVYELVAQQPMGRLTLDEVRGLDAVRDTVLEVPLSPTGALADVRKATGVEVFPLHIRVVHGLGAAKKVVEELRQALEAGGDLPFHFCEVMACPGGCVAGGGQPRQKRKDIAQLRQQAIYTEDERCTLRRSDENPDVAQIYERWLGHPGSHKAHRLLHTEYVKGEPPK